MFFCVILITCICTSCGNDLVSEYSKVVYNMSAKSSDIVDDKINNDAVMIVIDDTNVTYSEVMLHILSMQKEYETVFSSNIWNYSFDDIDKSDLSFEKVAKENIIKQIIMLKVLKSKASKKVSLNNAEVLEVKKKANKYLDKLPKKVKEEYSIKEDMLVNFFEENYIASKMYDLLTMEAKVADDDIFFEKYKEWEKDYDIYVVSELWDKISFID